MSLIAVMPNNLTSGKDVSKRVTPWAIVILTAACFAARSLAADDAWMKKDLFAVITLHGLPCGEVVSVETRGNNDHVASCKDGNRYHVFLNPQGRVVVDKQ
ncbi:MAG TPA: hypothetical protein VGT81_13400 [Casimicrobiaceae bacterium]|nr:hypothetical protein [Casimicrobiaceae bacterium]